MKKAMIAAAILAGVLLAPATTMAQDSIGRHKGNQCGAAQNGNCFGNNCIEPSLFACTFMSVPGQGGFFYGCWCQEH